MFVKVQLFIVFIMLLSSCVVTPNKPNDARSREVISFGDYYWYVLYTDEENSRKLIITKDIIGTHRITFPTPDQLEEYDYTACAVWEHRDLRKQLNDEFYYTFAEEERNRIIQGGGDTIDYIFLLSIEEAELLFKNNVERIALYDGEALQWWLRSPGFNMPARVHSNGEVSTRAVNVPFVNGGIRPALWYNTAKKRRPILCSPTNSQY